MNYEIKTETKDLKERTKSFALGIIRLFSTLPKSPEAQIIGKQLLRSGTSVGANYREAFSIRSKAEFIAKAGDSLKELEETAYWLELMKEGALYPAAKLQPIMNECNELLLRSLLFMHRAAARDADFPRIWSGAGSSMTTCVLSCRTCSGNALFLPSPNFVMPDPMRHPALPPVSQYCHAGLDPASRSSSRLLATANPTDRECLSQRTSKK